MNFGSHLNFDDYANNYFKIWFFTAMVYKIEM